MLLDSYFERFIKNNSSFEFLNKLFYENITINNIGIRIIGIYYMDNGYDWEIKHHKHSFFEYHYIVKNSVYTTINGHEYKLNPGEYYIIPPGFHHSHSQKNSTTGHIGFAMRWEFITSTSESDNLISLLINRTKPIKDKGNIIKNIIELTNEISNDTSKLEMQLVFFRLLLQIAEYKNSNTINKESSDLYSIQNNIIKSAISFIEENYTENIYVKDIANSAHISYSQLSRIFKNILGESVKEYLNKIRIKKALYLLKCSNKSLSTISREIGYNSENYFSNCFSKYIGISPNHYRKNPISLECESNIYKLKVKKYK
jgi:AraC family transcriptional activator of pobA